MQTGVAAMSTLALGGAVLTGPAAAREGKKIKLGQSRVSRLGGDDQTDIYVLELAEATDVTVTMSVGTKRGDGDGNANGQDVAEDTTASLELFDSSGTVMGSDVIETGSGKNEAQIVVSPLSVGTHTIEASTDTVGPDPFPYTLTVSGSL